MENPHMFKHRGLVQAVEYSADNTNDDEEEKLAIQIEIHIMFLGKKKT